MDRMDDFGDVSTIVFMYLASYLRIFLQKSAFVSSVYPLVSLEWFGSRVLPDPVARRVDVGLTRRSNPFQVEPFPFNGNFWSNPRSS